MNDVDCYHGCMGGLAAGATSDCRAEYRASLECEATATEFDTMWRCDAPACAGLYNAAGLCTGFCYHLGGAPFGGSIGDVCSWGSRCLEHDYEMECPSGPSPACSCTIDGVEVGTCQLDGDIEPFACPDKVVFAG